MNARGTGKTKQAKSQKAIQNSLNYPQYVYGIDFSGATDAGKKIWITSGIIEKGVLKIHGCQSAEHLPGSGSNHDKSMAALRHFIQEKGDGIFGFDFPFGIPRRLMNEKNWKDFVISFPYRFLCAQDFRDILYAESGGVELKRITDIETKTPFSPYNIRLYRQSYYGIRDILHPLIKGRKVRVIPMQKAVRGKPWLIEVCPASTLKKAQLYVPYKGKAKVNFSNRVHILKRLQKTFVLSLSGKIRSIILNDYHGDAIDSLIAACIAFRHLRNQAFFMRKKNKIYALEGYVYV